MCFWWLQPLVLVLSFSLLTSNLYLVLREWRCGRAGKVVNLFYLASAGKSPGGEHCLPIGTLLSADFELWFVVQTQSAAQFRFVPPTGGCSLSRFRCGIRSEGAANLASGLFDLLRNLQLANSISGCKQSVKELQCTTNVYKSWSHRYTF